MGIIKSIFENTLGSTVEKIGGAIRSFVTTDKDRIALQIKIEEILKQRDLAIEETVRAELNAKAEILKAELAQGDNYTKRARPSVIYFGLFYIFWNYMFIPTIFAFLKTEIPSFPPLPVQFWYAWGGICSTYVVGRSMEKRGMVSKAVDVVTGGKSTAIQKMVASW